MEEQLKKVAKSYDIAIELGIKGINQYENLSLEVINNSNYKLFLEMKNNEELCDSGRKEIYDFLEPKKGMKFIDLGCCLNIMFRGYDQWDSTYYGVDISKKTIDLLDNYTKKHNIIIGSLYNGSMHSTPFEDEFFDIGCCIGSLEYFEKSFVIECLKEINRILKKGAKFVLDIPNFGNSKFEITALIEKSLGREDKFNMSIFEFEKLLVNYFVIKKEEIGPMIEYFLIKK